MIQKQRDVEGRLRVPFFVALIPKYMDSKKSYDANEFKEYVRGLAILSDADWHSEKNGYPKWKHRIDRAAQKVFTDV